MSEVLTELVAKISTDASGLKSGLSQAEGVTEKSSQAMQASLRKVGMAMVAVGAAITGAMGLALKATMDYESAFTGVRKTVTATEEEFAALSAGIMAMSKTLPIAAGDLAAIAESAGQLGIETKSILGFTEVIAGLGMATNLAGQEGATMLARFANITGMAQSDFSKLGSTIVDLGNNFATTEAEIVTMSMQLAGTGTIIGLTETEILALSTALSSLGVKAERGGTAFATIMLEMNSAVTAGGDKLEIWASIAGDSVDDFSAKFREDAMGSIVDVIGGLKRLNDSGTDTAGILDSIGLGGIRVTDSLFRMANNEKLLKDAILTANDAWEKDIALKEEVDKRNKTLASQMTILKNTVTAFAISIGDQLAPIVQDFIEQLKPVIEGVTKWAEANPKLIELIAKLTVGTGALLLVLGSLLFTLPTLTAMFHALIVPIAILGGASMGLIGLLIAGIGLLGFGIVQLVGAGDKESQMLQRNAELLYKNRQAIYEFDEATSDFAMKLPEISKGFQDVALAVDEATDALTGMAQTGMAALSAVDKAIVSIVNARNQANIRAVAEATVAGMTGTPVWDPMMGSYEIPKAPEIGFTSIPAPWDEYHQGGIVPGRPGQEVPILAEAGEIITPAGGGGGVTINQYIAGSVIAEREIGAIAQKELLRLGRLNYSTGIS